MSSVILVLVITNIWIFLYRFIIAFLNNLFRPSLDKSFLVGGIHTEQFEIPIYIALTVILLLVVFRFRRLVNSFITLSLSQKAKWIIAILFGVVFLFQLGDYPSSQNSSEISYVTPFMRHVAIGVVFMYLLVILVLTVGITKIADFLKKKKNGILLLYGVILATIALFTFEPGFPISWFDYSYYFGPILEVSHGRTLYNEVPSLYGFLSIITFSTLTNLEIFKLSYLPLVIFFLTVILYFLCFYLIYTVSKSKSYSLIALFSIITVNYFSLNLPSISIPQSGAMRWVILVFSLFLFSIFKNLSSLKLIVLLSLLTLIQPDTGLYIIFAFALTLAFFSVKKICSDFWAIETFGKFIIVIISFFTVINLILIAFGYSFININMLFAKLMQYSLGSATLPVPHYTYLLPIPHQTYFWFVVLIYFSSIIYFFQNSYSDKSGLILFSANISLFASLYYVGRSHPQNLLFVSVIFLLNLFLLIGTGYSKLPYVLRIAALLLIFVLFITYPAYQRRISLSYIIYMKLNRLGIKSYEEKLPKKLIYHFCKPEKIHIFESEMDECLNMAHRADSQFIKKNLKDPEILILSPDDTYLFYMTGKKNMLYANPQADILTSEQLDFSLKRALQICPKQIAVDPEVIGERQVQRLNFAYTVQPLLFDKLERECRLNYHKKACSQNICIVESK